MLSLLHFLSHVLGKLPTLLHVFQNSGHKHLDAEEKNPTVKNSHRDYMDMLVIVLCSEEFKCVTLFGSPQHFLIYLCY